MMVNINVEEKLNSVVASEETTTLAKEIHALTGEDFSSIVAKLQWPDADAYLKQIQKIAHERKEASELLISIFREPELNKEAIAKAVYTLEGTSFSDTMAILDNQETQDSFIDGKIGENADRSKKNAAEALIAMLNSTSTENIIEYIMPSYIDPDKDFPWNKE